MEAPAELATQAVVGEILSNPALLTRYRRDRDAVLGERLQTRGVAAADIEEAKNAARTKIDETDAVFPGLSREEARGLLLGSLGVPGITFWIFTILNTLLFATGIGLLILGAVVGLAKGKEQFTIMFGVGGFATIAAVFLTDPLRRIANTASDHSQIRSIIFGYWVQLANWRTEVLRPNDVMTPEALHAVNADIQKSMDHAVKLLQRYTEAKDVPPVPPVSQDQGTPAPGPPTGAAEPITT